MRRVAVLVAVLVSGSLISAASADLGTVVGRDGLTDLDGRRWTTRTLADRVVLVDVWATWCAPCLAELPTLRRLAGQYPDRVVVLGVSLDTIPRRDFVAWLGRHRVEWPQHFDGRGFAGPVATRLGIEMVPQSFLYDTRGRLYARDLRGADLLRAVATLVSDGVRP